MIAHCRPVFQGREREYIEECFRTGWVATGPFVERFEEMLTRRVKAHVVTVSSGTVALMLALRAVGVMLGDQVIVPALTFVATVNSVRLCHAIPMYQDVDPKTWTLSVFDTSRVTIPVYLYGTTPSQPDPLLAVEDAAAALGAYELRSLAGILSFNGNKIITAGGGGAVLLEDPALAAVVRSWSQHQSDHDGAMRGQGNYRMSNLQAAVGVAQLEQLDDFLAAKTRIAAVYTAGLIGVEWQAQEGVSNHWQYGGLCHDAEGLVAHLRAAGIEARRLWRPLADLPVANDLYRRGVLLPCSVDLIEQDQERVIQEVRRWIRSV